MDHRAILEELLDLLAGRNVKIRTESMGGGGGGLCEIKDSYVFFLDSESGSYESALQAARAVLRVLEDPESIFLRPAVRDFLDRVKEMD